MLITSPSNPKVKSLSQLINSKKARDERGVFIVEGDHLVEDAMKANVVQELIISNMDYDHYAFANKTFVTEEIMKKICDTMTPQGIIALCEQHLSDHFKSYERILLLDGIQDPGNLGTIIRSCDAFRFDGIVLSPQTVDLYNPKVLRATQGAIFRVHFIRQDLKDYVAFLKQQGVSVYGTCLDGKPLKDTLTSEKMAFIMGNEGNGISKELLSITNHNIFIEMQGDSESLNVGVASSIIMYKFQK